MEEAKNSLDTSTEMANEAIQRLNEYAMEGLRLFLESYENNGSLWRSFGIPNTATTKMQSVSEDTLMMESSLANTLDTIENSAKIARAITDVYEGVKAYVAAYDDYSVTNQMEAQKELVEAANSLVETIGEAYLDLSKIAKNSGIFDKYGKKIAMKKVPAVGLVISIAGVAGAAINCAVKGSSVETERKLLDSILDVVGESAKLLFLGVPIASMPFGGVDIVVALTKVWMHSMYDIEDYVDDPFQEFCSMYFGAAYDDISEKFMGWHNEYFGSSNTRRCGASRFLENWDSKVILYGTSGNDVIHNNGVGVKSPYS